MEQSLIDIFLEIGERSDWGEHFESPEILRARIECYSSKLMHTYDPHYTVWDFQIQLLKWLNNADSIEDKYLLINSLSYFTFFNRDQCAALYREALYGPTIRWLIDIENYDITDIHLNDRIKKSIRQTFFSAATDSMNISDFRHTCGLSGSPLIWRAYVNKKDTEKEIITKVASCKKDLRDGKYKQIVVLDDFIGSGDQTEGVIDFLGHFQEWRILFIPLLVCPQGNEAIIKHLKDKTYHHISYEPVSVLPWELILSDKRPLDSKPYPRLLAELKAFAEAIHERVIGQNKTTPQKTEYLGYKSNGALFAKFTNCPNNTLPMYHKKSDCWEPLFLRSDR